MQEMPTACLRLCDFMRDIGVYNRRGFPPAEGAEDPVSFHIVFRDVTSSFRYRSGNAQTFKRLP